MARRATLTYDDAIGDGPLLYLERFLAGLLPFPDRSRPPTTVVGNLPVKKGDLRDPAPTDCRAGPLRCYSHQHDRLRHTVHDRPGHIGHIGHIGPRHTVPGR